MPSLCCEACTSCWSWNCSWITTNTGRLAIHHAGSSMQIMISIRNVYMFKIQTNCWFEMISDVQYGCNWRPPSSGWWRHTDLDICSCRSIDFGVRQFFGIHDFLVEQIFSICYQFGFFFFFFLRMNFLAVAAQVANFVLCLCSVLLCCFCSVCNPGSFERLGSPGLETDLV